MVGGEIDVRATVSSLSDLSVTATASELNIMDGVTLLLLNLIYLTVLLQQQQNLIF